MHILFLSQFFTDSSGTSQLLTDMAGHLAAEGHRVRVICGRSCYTEPCCVPPATVETVRVPTFHFARGPFARTLSYVSYLFNAVFYSLLGPRPDVVVTLTTPPALPLIGSLLKAARRVRHVIWEMDVYPDIAVDLEVLSAGSWFTRLVGAALDSARRRADGIIAIGPSMQTRLIHHGIPASKIHVAEHWADRREIYPLPFPGVEPLELLYSGNLGLAHDLDTILAALDALGSDHRFQFSFAGAGAQRVALEDFCRENEIGNVSFAGYLPRRELVDRLGACHIGLITQKPATLGSVVPSKTYSLMAAGRPFLFIGPREATPARIIRRFRCGWQIDPGDSASLVALLEHLAANPKLVRDAGARGHEAFLQHYDFPHAAARFCSILGVAQPLRAKELVIS